MSSFQVALPESGVDERVIQKHLNVRPCISVLGFRKSTIVYHNLVEVSGLISRQDNARQDLPVARRIVRVISRVVSPQ